MAKTLIIKNADYSDNALDVVAFDAVPCTGIELNKSTAEITAIGGTTTITATLTPANTTDMLSWASSDTDVATVVDGVVTTVGVGTATITATCGNQTATCVITSRAFMNTANVLERLGYYFGGTPVSSGGNGIPSWDVASSRRGGLASSTGNYSIYNLSNVFPYTMPKGTKQVKITLASGSSISGIQGIYWFNHETNQGEYATVAKYLANTATASISGSKTVDVPVVDGLPDIDALIINFEMGSGTMTSEILATATVEFLPEA